MDQPTSRRGREPIEAGRFDSPRAIVLFHGYTGSTRDFNDLPERIAEALDAYVYVPLLPGHGTHVEELLPLDFDAFSQAADDAVERTYRDGRVLVFGGHSFGAYLAILAAQKYESAGLFTSAIPYQLRFPYSSFIGRTLSQSRTLWAKHLSMQEREARRDVFFYPQMPGKALSLVHEGKRRISETALDCPMLTIHAASDTLAHASQSVYALETITSGQRESLIVQNGSHSVFISSKDKEATMSRITDFVGRSFANGGQIARTEA